MLEPFAPSELTAVELAELTELHNAVYLETRPDDPPKPLRYVRDLYASLAASTEHRRHFWRAWRGGALAGALTASQHSTGGNGHVLHVELQVAPEARRQRVGAALMGRAAALARADGQDVIIALVTGPGRLADRPGGRFLLRLGGRPGLHHHIHRLELRDVDVEELERWRREGAERSPDLELVWRFEPFREHELDDVGQLMRAMNGAPRDELEVEPTVYTSKSVYERDRALFRRGYRRAVLLARQREGGALLGYTMMLVDPYDARLLRQADTAVEPAARGRGLGTWLKAAMLLRMMEEHPDRTEVRTGTADSNRAMLAINHRIGFRPWLAHSVWQVSLEALEGALRELGEAG